MSLSSRSCARLRLRRSRKASPIAQSLTLRSALKAWAAAPVPRPPQPIRPTLSVSLPPAWTDVARAPAATTAEALRNWRREEADGWAGGRRVMERSPRRLEVGEVRSWSVYGAVIHRFAFPSRPLIGLPPGRSFFFDLG